MKTQKFLFLCVLLCAFTTVHSQFEKADRMVSLTVAPYPTSQNGQDDIGMILKVDAEFFITKSLSFVTSGFYSGTATFKNNSGLPLNAFGIIPSVQYYVVNKEKWGIHALVGYGFGFTDRNFRASQNSAISVVSLGAGAHYKLGEKLYIKLQVPYFKAQNISYDFTEVEGAAPFIGLSYEF